MTNVIMSLLILLPLVVMGANVILITIILGSRKRNDPIPFQHVHILSACMILLALGASVLCGRSLGEYAPSGMSGDEYAVLGVVSALAIGVIAQVVHFIAKNP